MTHFVKRRNVIFEHAKFNRRVQQEGEPVDDFIIDLYSLVEHCDYGQLHDQMVRDRIVIGIRDSQLSEKLQMDSKLTVEKATVMARQSKSVKLQQRTVRNDLLREAQIELVKNQTHKQPYYHQSKDSSRPQNPPARPNNCSRCGQTPSHGRAHCPASEVICHNCKKKGHFKAFCRSKSAIDQLAETTEIQDGVHSLVTSESAEESDDNSFLGMIHENKSNPWVTELTLNGQAVQFKIDTGADVTVIPNTEYSRSRDGLLSPADRTLSGPGQHVLKVKGKFVGCLERNHRSIQQTIYVIEDLHKGLLGCPAIQALQILSFVEPVQASDIFIQFPQLFTGLGKLQDSYQIKLRNDAKPCALNAPRRIAIPLLPKVKEELQRMEALGVISRLKSPQNGVLQLLLFQNPMARFESVLT